MTNTNIHLGKLLQSARDLDRASHRDGEVKKLGVLRAGSTGAMSVDGDIVGACHRTSLLRSKGIELDPPTADKLIMFELGFANEQVVYDQLAQSLPEGHFVLQEEEIPIEWFTSNGTKVSGRPDQVICQKDSTGIPKTMDTISGLLHYIEYNHKPILGIELKSIHSMWTARDVLFGREPKLNNLLQAGHYMWKLSVPYKLHYKSYSQLGQGIAGGKSWVANLFPKQGEPGSELIEYNDSGNIKHIKQFEIVFDLRFGPTNRLEYRVESEDDSTPWTSTIIERDDIARYYEYVSTMESELKLGPRPLTLHADGKKLNYSACDYCPLQSTCDKYESRGFEEWMNEVKVLFNKSDK